MNRSLMLICILAASMGACVSSEEGASDPEAPKATENSDDGTGGKSDAFDNNQDPDFWCGENNDVQCIERSDFIAKADIDFTTDVEHVDFPILIPFDQAPRADLPILERFEQFDAYAEGLNITNAAWMAFFAANQYRHFVALAPELARAGFGRNNEIEAALWQQCGRDLYALRNAEENGDITNIDDLRDLVEGILPGPGVGGCIRSWYREELENCADTGCTELLQRNGCRYQFLGRGAGCNERWVSLSAALENWLVHTTDSTSYLQFFSGGSYQFESSVGKMVFETGSTQVFWARHGTKPIVVISFRGTEFRDGQLWLDVRSDLNLITSVLRIQATSIPPEEFQTEEVEWGKVHKGFIAAFDEVSGLMHTKLGDLYAEYYERLVNGETPETIQVFVTGHSLGGALATLQAAQIMQEVETFHELGNENQPFRLAGVYTFGSPRVATSEFVERFDRLAREQGATVARFRNGGDLVTGVPFNLGGFLGPDYTHVDGIKHLVQGENLLRCDGEALGRSVSFRDHSIAPPIGSDPRGWTYYERIISAVNGETAVHSGCGDVEGIIP